MAITLALAVVFKPYEITYVLISAFHR